MSFNLGAGLAAADGFFAGQEHTQDRDYLQQQRDFQTKQNQASLDMLPDQVAAGKSGYQMTAARNAAGLDLLPGQIDNSKKAITVQGAGLDQAIADIPQANKHRAFTNAATDHADNMQALGIFGQLASNGDKAGAIDHLNKVGKARSANYQDVTDIVPGANGYKLMRADGTSVDMPFAAVQNALGMMKSGKYRAVKGEDGSIHTINESTGAVATPVKADPEIAMAMIKSKQPALVQNSEWMVKNGVAKDASEAVAKQNTAKQKSEVEWVGDMLRGFAKPGVSSAKLNQHEQELRAMYRRITSGGATPAVLPTAVPSNSLSASKIGLEPPADMQNLFP